MPWSIWLLLQFVNNVNNIAPVLDLCRPVGTDRLRVRLGWGTNR
jgi:hypothetical protein